LVVVLPSGRYDVAHPKIREASLAAVLPATRCALHRQIAEALATRPDGGVKAELARHWEGAGEHQKAMQAHLAAGADALDVYHPAAAVRHFDAALTVMDRYDVADVELRVEALLGRGRGLAGSGVGRQACDDFEAALQLTRCPRRAAEI